MYSQLGQDLWVLESTNYKRDGYFIDVGAYDGVYHSNTYLLEKEYGWNGICVEASSKYEDLSNNRYCSLSNRLVYSQDNLDIEFYETINNMELCGIPHCFNEDGHQNIRGNFVNKYVKSISLTSLCQKHNSPSIIDYLSIDTEGSELLILQSHNFDQYRFNYISIEHNRCAEYRKNIRDFLNSQNYYLDTSERFYTINNNSDTNFDDWYVYKG
jgi:FkbM family methyltransferase